MAQDLPVSHGLNLASWTRSLLYTRSLLELFVLVSSLIFTDINRSVISAAYYTSNKYLGVLYKNPPWRPGVYSNPAFNRVNTVILSRWPEQKSDAPNVATPHFNAKDELNVQNDVVFCGERAFRREVSSKRYALTYSRITPGYRRLLASCQKIPLLVRHEQWGQGLHPAMWSLPIRWCQTTERTASATWHSNSTMGQGGFRSIPLQCWKLFYHRWLLDSTLSSHVIRKMKIQFARYGIPDIDMSDNGRQFGNEEYKRFSKMWKFQLITFSSHHPRSNGKAENAFWAAKRLMMKAKNDSLDVYLALLDYRNTVLKA